MVSQTCNHPLESPRAGNLEIGRPPHRAKPPAKAGKKAVAYTSQPPAVALERRAGSSSKERGAEIVESLGKVMAESTHQLQVAMAQCNQQVLAGMAQSNQHVMNGMGTMIQTMQSMQATQQGMMQEVRGLAAMGIMSAGSTELPDAAMQPPSVHGVAPWRTSWQRRRGGTKAVSALQFPRRTPRPSSSRSWWPLLCRGGTAWRTEGADVLVGRRQPAGENQAAS